MKEDETNSNSGNHSSTLSDRVMICTIVCKAEVERDDDVMVGYIAMLAVNQQYRKRGIGQKVKLYILIAAYQSTL